MKENQLRALIIEGDVDDYRATFSLLREVTGTEFDVRWVANYADGFEAVLSGAHDICLLAYEIADGKGIELLTDAFELGGRTPVIILSRDDDRVVDIEAMQAGAADCLFKTTLTSNALDRSIRHSLAHAKTLETLRESESRFRSVVESANDAIILTGQKGNIISWNRTAQMIFGHVKEDIIGQRLSMLFPESYYSNLTLDGTDPFIASVLMHPGAKAVEFTGLRNDGTEFPVEVSLSSWTTVEGDFYSAIVRDVTERKSLEDQLTHQALHDPLTKLANRALFRDRVSHALSRSIRTKVPVGVLFLDLDNFKNINDTLGHAAGDELLLGVARRLESCLRPSDTAARLGGDEFAVLLEDSNRADIAPMIAERIKEVLRSPFQIEGKDMYVGTSIGIATTENGRMIPEDLLRNADVAMYIAKSGGKDRYAVFEEEMHEELMRTAKLESDMRTGIYREEFEVYFQPIMDLESCRIDGMEALARWNHPERGVVSPIDFIPVAEQTNLILPLGRWIIHEACRLACEWQKSFGLGEHFYVTVNLSSRQFKDADLLRTVEEALAMSGLPPRSLVLEITETTMLLNTDATIRKLSDLKDLGVQLAIDDFGTGYSSLSYLQRFPVDILKIDKSFVERIADGAEGAAVTRAIITMSDTLKLKTIAEGIESRDQQSELKRLGCELGQGYLFAMPLRAGEMSEFLEDMVAAIGVREDPLPPQKEKKVFEISSEGEKGWQPVWAEGAEPMAVVEPSI